MTPEELERAERQFLAYYRISGNATQSAEKAGFKHAQENGVRLKDRLITKELVNYVDFEGMSKKDQEEWIKQFFACVMCNNKAPMRDRLTSARTLAQILQMFETREGGEECSEALSQVTYDELKQLLKEHSGK